MPTEAASAGWIRLLSACGWPAVLVLIASSVGFLALVGRLNIAIVSIVPAAMAGGILYFAGRRLPDARIVLRGDSEVKLEALQLLRYAVVYPILLFPLALIIKGHSALLFPGILNSPIVSIGNVLGDKVFLLAVPALLFARRFGGIRRQLQLRHLRQSWRWMAPVLAISVLLVVQLVLGLPKASHLSPWLAIALAATAFVYAGLPEELYYRVLLQTRLELLLGRPSGIAVASLLFGLRHVPSRFVLVWLGTTWSAGLDLALTVAVILSVQTVFGLVFGYMWSRYRNVWLNVGGHTAYDFLNFVGMLA